MRFVLCLALLCLAPFAAMGQTPPRVPSAPADPLELVTVRPEVAAGQDARDEALQLLTRARNSYSLRNSRQPWDLKVRVATDSQGATNYDGAWEIEDRFLPGQGVRWSAQASAGYKISGIFGTQANYTEGATTVIPLRLQEARAMLFNPIPSVAYADAGSIRTATATFRGSQVVCILLNHSRKAVNPEAGRAWEESEECIDPQSGLLQLHSEAPGRYAVYDYTNAPHLGKRVLPRTVSVTEAGRVVSTISVESLAAVAPFDPALFVPTEGMKAAGPATEMTSATKISRIQGQGAPAAGTAARTVCVFGLVTSSGKLVEAHSLQPSDPNSAAALNDAQSIDFSPAIKAGAPPQQHFVFVIEKFLTTGM